MFKITTANGSVILTEKPQFIRKFGEGCFAICRTAREIKTADGVAYKGKPYLYKDGVNVVEFDGADELRKLYSENEALLNQLATTDEATIELFETALAQEQINAEYDEAIIGIYETLMEVSANNG